MHEDGVQKERLRSPRLFLFILFVVVVIVVDSRRRLFAHFSIDIECIEHNGNVYSPGLQ